MKTKISVYFIFYTLIFFYYYYYFILATSVDVVIYFQGNL